MDNGDWEVTTNVDTFRGKGTEYFDTVFRLERMDSQNGNLRQKLQYFVGG